MAELRHIVWNDRKGRFEEKETGKPVPENEIPPELRLVRWHK